MNKVAQFEKISYGQFEKDIQKVWFNSLDGIAVSMMYDDITLPVRKTVGSAGYDFVIPFNISIKPKDSFLIPTGIRCRIDEGWVLKCYPRSGLGTKYRAVLANVVPIIDSDYFYSDNEGHIFAKICNDNDEGKVLRLKSGDAFMQGIFVEYGVTYDDDVDGVRNGGFGSTDV